MIKKKNAFTLVELLATILILSAIVLIVAPLVVNQISNARADISEQTKKNIVASATNWANDNKKLLPENDNDKGAVWIEVLQEEGYLQDDITDPSGEDINSGCVVITNHNGVYYYEYHRGTDAVCQQFSIKKKITFNASENEGRLTSGEETRTEYYYRNQIVPIQDVEATKNGNPPYEFLGWNTDKNAHNGLSSYTVGNTEAELFAIYRQPKRDYTITFNANGGIGNNRYVTHTVPAAYNKDSQPLTFDIILPANSFTRNGYEFVGWSTNPNATSGQAANTSVTLQNDETSLNIVYYAIWKKNSYTVTYNYSYNGGTSAQVSSTTATAGTQVDLTPTAYKSGWTFVGWNTNQNATSALSSYTMPERNVTLYAIYKKPAKSYRITTNANGGSGTAYSSSCTIPAVYNNATQKTSCTAVLPSNGFSRSGYTFNGWSTNSSASSGYSPGTSVSISSNKTYYATWSSNTKSYTLTYRPNGASGSYYYDTCTTTSGSSSCRIRLRNNPYSRSGYSFGGWGTTSSGGTIYDEGDYITMSSSRSVYAKWTKTSSSKTYTATFYSNGRSYSTKSCTTTGSSCSITTPSAPTSSTYKPNNATSFRFWGTSSTATSGTGANRSLTLTGSRTYYAVWQTSSSSGGSKPSCSLTLSGTKGNNSWYTSDVKVNMSTSGTVTSKGLATSQNSTNGRTSVTHTADTRSVTYYGYVKNSAGSSSCSITFKKDETKPTLNYTLNRYGWGSVLGSYTSGQYTVNQVQRILSPSDNMSGVARTEYRIADQSTWYTENNVGSYIFNEGVDDTYYRVIDNAGNISSNVHLVIKVDWTPPAFRCSFNSNKSDCQPNSHIGGACNYTDNYPGSGINYITRSGTYTYNYSGSGCGNTGTFNIEVKANWDTGFDFCFWCGSRSQVTWRCNGACDNAGNCTGTGYCGPYSW